MFSQSSDRWTCQQWANVEEIEAVVTFDNSLDLLLRSPDNLTAVKMAEAINNYPGTALATDGGVVNVNIPAQFAGQTTNFIAAVGSIDVRPDVAAKVIINERTGTIVATQNVRISPVAVSNSNVTIFLNQPLESANLSHSLKVQLP